MSIAMLSFFQDCCHSYLSPFLRKISMNRVTWLRFPALFLILCALSASAGGQTVPPSLYSGMVWRNIGPFRGGRVAAVTGVVGQPGTFYMGMPLGGVWKTTSAGATWYPVFDSVKEASSVGAIQVAPSDPKVIYVGMGDLITGGGINRGNGVYKSTDAGATWQHLGLEKTEHIPSILVDPHDPNLVMVAAQGSINAKSDDRGLYRSTDGGKTWKTTLRINSETGVQKIAWAYDHPNVMLATTMHYYNAPAQVRGPGGAAGAGGGAPGQRAAQVGGLYKSTDEGLTWKEIDDESLPEITGRTSCAIAMNTNAQRMYVVGNFGLYRSDDGGGTWRHMDAADRRVSNGQGGYNCGVYVDSQNPDIVYVVNTCCYRSTDGGKTFTGFKGAPGGDDPQQLWIDPTDGKRLFFGTDQGATISLDGGLNWSSWYNQSTAQVYHISVDNQFPYWVYATQQDSGSVATSSRGNLGAITPLDWLPHPGYEFGSIVADPLNPKISYAGGPGGGIIRTTYPSGQWIDVSPNADSSLGLRKVSNQPLLYSHTDPHELFAGFQYLMATTDGGKRWRKLSPDLTLKPGETPAPPAARRPGAARPGVAQPGAARPGAVTPPPVVAPPGPQSQMEENDEDDDNGEGDEEEREAQRAVGSGAIESISSSSIDGKVIWAGTSNGLIKVSRDHGATWEDVTIPNLPNPTRADISAIDASHQEIGTAYVAIDFHGVADFKPYFYRTHDFGKSWTAIVAGLPEDQPSGSFARVIRADTVRKGLLFAGTESSVYVSFDDGDHWQSLVLNLPNTSYRDMVVKDNDLVVGTYGRGFWILDDISPLREITSSIASEPAHLFKPAMATRMRRNVNGDTPFPPEIPHAENPLLGATIYYALGSQPSGDITLEVRDAHGLIVRRMSSAAMTTLAEPAPPVPDFWLERPAPLPTTPGLNRTNWNLRYDSPAAFSHNYEINANPGQTPASPEGPLALPGVYTVTLTVTGKAYTQTVTVRNDPRSPASPGDLREQHELQMSVYRCAQDSWDAYHQITAVRTSIAGLLTVNPPEEVATAARALDTKLTAIGGTAGFGRRPGGGGGGFPGTGAAAAPTLRSFYTLNGAADRQINALDSGDMAPNEAIRKACAATCADFLKAQKAWDQLMITDFSAFNTLLSKNNLKPIVVTAPIAQMRRKP
ncbi:MAG: hypothetical protein JWN14_755 [Chthonomonadales bacterium]|nr:hypothetical protein [Chthonomonadales bacterium]